MFIPFSPPDISKLEIDEVVDTLQSGWITTGPKTKLLEGQLAEYVHTERAVCLNSATAAMELTLRLFGVGNGDEIITSAYTYSASASVINHVGAKIVMVDTGKDSYQMDYDQLENAISENTKAVIPVDIAGVMCDYDHIFQILDNKKHLFKPKHKLQEALGRVAIVADAAHSLGAVQRGRQSGEVADFTNFSFHAVKNLTTGEGGAVTWRDIAGIDSDEIYKEFMLLSLHGQSKDALAKTKLGSWEYDIVYPGYKCNMTDISASLGISQLKRYPDLLLKRRRIIEMYDSGLSSTNLDILQHFDTHSASSGHLYLTRLNSRDEHFRNKVIVQMADCGIATNVHYKPLPLHTAYKKLGFDIKDYPKAFAQYRNEITLPLHTLLTDEQVDYIIETYKNCLK